MPYRSRSSLYELVRARAGLPAPGGASPALARPGRGRGLRAALALAACAAARAGGACVRVAPNEEFRASPGNFAHWLLAAAYPRAAARGAAAAPPRAARAPLARGDSDRLAAWRPHGAALLWPAAATSAAPAGPCAGAGARVRAPHLAFCAAAHWRALPAFARGVRARARAPRAGVHARLRAPRVVVLLRRGGGAGARAWDVRGLGASCRRGALRRAVRAGGGAVDCVAADAAAPLGAVARRLGAATAVVGAHGAALANLAFAPRGAALVELDAAAHAARGRQLYQAAARALGLYAARVWLGADGRARAATRVGACAAARPDGSRVAGAARADLAAAGVAAYDAPAALGPAAARAVATAAAARGGGAAARRRPRAPRARRPRAGGGGAWGPAAWPAAAAARGAAVGEPAARGGGGPAAAERAWLARALPVATVRGGGGGARALLVAHAPAAADQAALRALGRALRRAGRPAALAHLSDESAARDGAYEAWPLVLRQYAAPALAARWGPRRLAWLPLGPVAPPPRAAAAAAAAAARRAAWAFAGDARPGRRAARRAARGARHATARSTTGRPWRRDVWRAATHARLLAAAADCPAPRGFRHAETFRWWDAAAAGCAPRLGARAGGGYFAWLARELGRAPGVRTAGALSRGGPRAARAVREVAAGVRRDAAARLAYLDAARARPAAVFVAVPRTGTRSVLAALRAAPRARAREGRPLPAACRLDEWARRLRAGGGARFGGRTYRGRAGCWRRLARACAAAQAAAARAAFDDGGGGGGAAAAVFYDHVPQLPTLGDRAAHVAVLREPLAWAASHYYFTRTSRAPLADALAGGSAEVLGARAPQARYACGAAPACAAPWGQAGPALLARFAAVGVAEDLARTFAALERALPRVFGGAGAAFRGSVGARRAGAQPADAARPRAEVLPDAAAAALRRALAEDAALYRAARARLRGGGD